MDTFDIGLKVCLIGSTFVLLMVQHKKKQRLQKSLLTLNKNLRSLTLYIHRLRMERENYFKKGTIVDSKIFQTFEVIRAKRFLPNVIF